MLYIPDTSVYNCLNQSKSSSLTIQSIQMFKRHQQGERTNYKEEKKTPFYKRRTALCHGSRGRKVKRRKRANSSRTEQEFSEMKKALKTTTQPLPLILRASDVKLGLAISSEHTPVLLVSSLAVVTDRGWLPGLVEGLEVEDVETPGKSSADALVVELLSVGSAGDGLTIRGTAI